MRSRSESEQVGSGLYIRIDRVGRMVRRSAGGNSEVVVARAPNVGSLRLRACGALVVLA